MPEQEIHLPAFYAAPQFSHRLSLFGRQILQRGASFHEVAENPGPQHGNNRKPDCKQNQAAHQAAAYQQNVKRTAEKNSPDSTSR